MKVISLKLSETVDAQLTALARQRGTSKSAVVREALEALFTANGGKPAVSCLDLVHDLVGRVQGPGDLSVNKQYLEDLGR